MGQAPANPRRLSPETIRSVERILNKTKSETDMNETYSAIEVTKPGELSVTRKPLQEPGPDQVRIRVEACGVCHSDSGTVEGLFPIDWQRVPGHEVVGHVDAIGSLH